MTLSTFLFKKNDQMTVWRFFSSWQTQRELIPTQFFSSLQSFLASFSSVFVFTATTFNVQQHIAAVLSTFTWHQEASWCMFPPGALFLCHSPNRFHNNSKLSRGVNGSVNGLYVSALWLTGKCQLALAPAKKIN